MNFSNITLSPVHVKVLSKGLNIFLANRGFDEFQLFKDLYNFARNIRLREYFYDHPATEEAWSTLPSYKHWTLPTQRDSCLDMYIKAVQRDVRKEYQTQISFQRNMTTNEKKALEEIASSPDIIIKPAEN